MPKLQAPVPVCKRAETLACAIEQELHTLGLWHEERVEGDAETFADRIEFELVPLLRGLALGRVDRPEQTSVGTRGVVEFGDRPDAEQLEQLLFEVDRLIRGLRIELAGVTRRRATRI
jgi:hypothetical protein